ISRIAAGIKGLGDFLGNVHVLTVFRPTGRARLPVAAHNAPGGEDILRLRPGQAPPLRCPCSPCYPLPMPGFNGLRVLSFESRRAQEIAQLIRNNGGEPIVAPSTREVETPNEDELNLIRGILSHEFDAVIFMTGVGARALVHAAESIGPKDEFLDALRRVRVMVRGPKPAAVMRQ